MAPNPYVSDSALPVTPAGAINLTDMRPRAYHAANSFQLVSAGRDGRYGIGGAWIEKGNERLPFYPSANQSATGQTLGANVRSVERDNLTNFAGKLD